MFHEALLLLPSLYSLATTTANYGNPSGNLHPVDRDYFISHSGYHYFSKIDSNHTKLKTSTAVNESRNDYIPANYFSSNFFQKLLKSIFLLHVTYRLVDFII